MNNKEVKLSKTRKESLDWFFTKSRYEKEEPKEETPFKHECEVISKEYIMKNRSNAYDFIDFNKKETLEEFISKSDTPEGLDQFSYDEGLKEGAKWQQERMYSEEEVIKILYKSHNAESTSIIANTLKKWFEQFKKK